jgi:SAM-dependent methyltransferase
MKEKIEYLLFSNKFYNVFFKPFDRIRYPVVSLEDLKGERQKNPVPLNKIANMADMFNPQWREVLEDMGTYFVMDEQRFHRKTWEHVHIAFVLKQAGCLNPSNRGLSVGAGREPVLYYLAHKVRKITGIDMYEGYYLGGEDEADICRHPAKFAPFVYPEERLELLQMDARHLDFGDAQFDFIFSASSIEHFGTVKDIKEAIREMYRVLKPGGGCVITTELKLNRFGSRIPNTRIFRLAELLQLFEESGFAVDKDGIDIRIEDQGLNNWIKLPQEVSRRPHLIMRYFKTVFTSLCLIFTRPGSDVQRGEWRGDTHIVPLDYGGEIEVRLNKRAFSRGEQAEIDVELTNSGNFDWYTGGASHRIALGVQLLDGGGGRLDQNFADFTLLRPVKKSESLHFTVRLPLDLAPGSYRLLFDLKRELVTWFAEQGNEPRIESIKILP